PRCRTRARDGGRACRARRTTRGRAAARVARAGAACPARAGARRPWRSRRAAPARAARRAARGAPRSGARRARPARSPRPRPESRDLRRPYALLSVAVAGSGFAATVGKAADAASVVAPSLPGAGLTRRLRLVFLRGFLGRQAGPEAGR